jgi:ribonucleoside-diphosphate reductase alpha chain
VVKKEDFYNISGDIWERKYRYSGENELPADKTIEDTFKRVAGACAAKETDRELWEKQFASILTDKSFLPGGRIIANAGTSRSEVTMFNCYVMNKIEDSIEGIFDTVKDSALTQKQGGGVGFDFSTLRPAGCSIKGCEAESSGPISFMQVMDSTCRTIMSAGQRRGAQMGVMRCDHPDIEKFITSKRNNGALQMFNLSVAITDEFIEAVKADKEWELKFNGEVYKTIHASELWDLIMKSTYDFAEPGFILIDHINQMNNLYYCEEIRATNPCGEQPLPPYGACLLGSLNLTRFVKNPFTSKAEVDFERIEKVTRIAVRLLDNVIDLSNYPLPQQRAEAMAKRRMGIGITGLANMFIFLGIKYGSRESCELAGKIMRTITFAAYGASADLAEEKGAFPKFDAEQYLNGKFVEKLPAELQEKIYKKGLRNSHLTSIAPTGTISLLAGNVSSGLEPVFAFSYNRKIRNSNENDVSEVEIADYAYQEYCRKNGSKVNEKDLPDYFVSSDQISPDEHLDIQAALQEYVDSSISKTINIPADYPFEDFKNIYMKAYEKGLKGCTTFRPSEHITGVLVKKEEKKKEEPAKNSSPIIKRPKELEGTTYKIKTPLSADALYVTINDLIEDNGRRHPYELFINTKNLQHFSWIVAMTRLISAVFRHDPEPEFLVNELKSIYDPNGGYFSEGSYVPSLAADIGRVIEKHLNKIGIIGNKESQKAPAVAPNEEGTKNSSAYMICPFCNEKKLISQENCLKCLACGYSKCN